MLQLQDINKSYTVGSNSLHVLKGIDLEIEPVRALVEGDLGLELRIREYNEVG